MKPTALHQEILNHIDDKTFNNIINRYNKCIGIESKITTLNENNKRVGRVLLIHYADTVPKNKRKKSLMLNQYVEFLENKVLYTARKVSGGYSVPTGFYLVDPYFVKPFISEIKLDVPITIYNKNTGKLENVIKKRTYKQYQQHRLDLMFTANNWTYKYINAYHNFQRIFASSGQYYLAINSTVMYYWVTEAELKSLIGKVDKFKATIKGEWNKYLKDKVEKDYTFRRMQKLYNMDEIESAVVIPGKLKAVK